MIETTPERLAEAIPRILAIIDDLARDYDPESEDDIDPYDAAEQLCWLQEDAWRIRQVLMAGLLKPRPVAKAIEV